MRVHWTDKRAGAGDSTEAAVVGGEQLRSFRRNRLYRAKLANSLLCHFGLKLEDWNGSKFLLSDRKGRQEIIEDLGDLWPVAEKLTGRRLDPLDPVLIGKLKQLHEREEKEIP
ncbi:hypothetical protein GCM10027443_06950 [Pontibacter brevis]